MALDGLSLTSLGFATEISPKDISHTAEETSKARAEQTLKEIEEMEKQQLDPDRDSPKDKNQQKNKKRKKLPQKAYVVEVESIEEEKNEKILELTAQQNMYKVIYNSDKEIVEITHSKTGEIAETLSLAELKSFIMKVKNPLGVIVDRTI